MELSRSVHDVKWVIGGKFITGCCSSEYGPNIHPESVCSIRLNFKIRRNLQGKKLIIEVTILLAETL